MGSPTPTPADSLHPIDWLVGEWVSDEYTATGDIGAIKKDDRVKSHWSIRWGPDRQFMIGDGYSTVNGRRLNSTHEINSCNKEKQEICTSIFSMLGAGKGTWLAVGDKGVLRWAIDGKEGKLQGTSHLNKKDTDTWTWQAKDVTLGAEKVPDTTLITFRRAVGGPKGDLWKAVSDKFKGTWEGEGSLVVDMPSLGLKTGDKFTCRLKHKLDKAGTALIGEGEFRATGKDAMLTGQGFPGWDPQLRQVRGFMFWSNGSMEEVAITGLVENGFVGSYLNKSVGKPSVRMQVRYEYPDDKSCIFKSTGRQGEELSTWKKVGD